MSFWNKALSAFDQEPEPEPVLSPEDVAFGEWRENRSALGIRDSSDFIGIGPWRAPDRPVQRREPSELEKYAAEREKLGVKDAPQSTVGTPRKNQSPYRAVNTGRFE